MISYVTHLCTSMLFTPANKPERFKKAQSIEYADGVVLDLEDAVSKECKEEARKQLFSYLQNNKETEKKGFIEAVRINPISTYAGLQDVLAMIDSDIIPKVIVLPKVENVQQVELYIELLTTKHQVSSEFIALIETAKGLENAYEIAKHERVASIAFGGGDLTADLGAKLTFDCTQSYRARVVQAAKAAGKQALDVPYLNFKDVEGLELETRQVKDLGFNGKFAIHPDQVGVIHRVFSPSEAEIEHAKKVVSVFESAHGGACELEGKMLDLAVVKNSFVLLQRYNN
ncbi:hypothetical protein SOPP22_18770 [Shewanella sp. OPT22]|nr:hypothetical protein SOPP22_18770 [Shewanella sp. OPT22]